MSEIIQLISYGNNERLSSDCLSDQNDHWNSSLSKNRPTWVFNGSFSINDVIVFGCVIDKQYDSLSCLIISFGTAKNLITFYKRKYWNTKYINYFFIFTSIFAKYGILYSKYVHNIRQSTADTGHSQMEWGGGIQHLYILQPRYITGLIHSPRGPHYNGVPLYIFKYLEKH